MARYDGHYERAFEAFLRASRLPYVSVNEAHRALLPRATGRSPDLKSFDFVVYSRPGCRTCNLLVDVKGRRVRPARRGGREAFGATARARLETWVTSEDVRSLMAWESMFGEEFRGAFAFAFWCDAQPPDALFEEVFEFRARWYVLRTVLVRDYATRMRTRSARWGTVHLDARAFDEFSLPMYRPGPGARDPGPEAIIG